MAEATETNLSTGPEGRRGRGRGDFQRPVLPLDKLFDKPPPQAPLAEMSLLGAMILEPSVIHDVIGIVKDPGAFFEQKHAAIYSALVRTYDQKQAGNLVLLAESLADNEQLKDVGGAAYLEKLAAETPGPATAVHFAKIVADKHRLRKLIEAGGQIVYDAYNAGELGPDGAKPIIDAAEALVFEIAQAEETSDAQSLAQLVEQEYQRLLALQGKGLSGIPTHYKDLDELTSGIQPGDMVIIAARPSMGKCLAAGEEIVLEDGSIATIEELYRRREGRIPTLRDDMKLGWAAPSDFIDDGDKPVFEVTTRLGRRIRTTLPHPFLTVEGWRPLGELSEGDRVAVPRRLEVFGNVPMRECEIKLLAYLIGDGGLTGTVARFTSRNPEIVADFEGAVREFGGLRLTVSDSRAECAPSWRVVSDGTARPAGRRAFGARLDRAIRERSRTRRWLAAEVGVSAASVTHWDSGATAPDAETFDRICGVLEVRGDDLCPGGLERIRKNTPSAMTGFLRAHGLMGAGSGAKHVPACVFTLPEPELALFLNRLFSTDGWATVLASGQSQLGYATISERLARQVQHLLLRFGVIASLRARWVKYREARRPSWQLDITDARSIRTFIERIGIHGKKDATDRVLAALRTRRYRTNRDLVPVEVWGQIARAKGEMSWSELARRIGGAPNMHVGARALSRERLGKIASVLGDAGLAALAESEVYWDEIVSIEPLGPMRVYDLTIPGTHNFVARDVCVHNTALALNLAEQVAMGGTPWSPKKSQPVPVAFFSLEMSKGAIAQRMLSARSGYSSHDMRSGRLRDEDYDRLCEAMYELHDAPMYIDDTPGLTVLGMRTRARRLVAQYGVKCIFVDYLQLMTAPGSARESRQVEVSAISRGVKALARELKVPVICLSQLNRGPESRGDNRPKMSDLRESGSIEQDADVVALLHRESYYHVGDQDWMAENESKINEAELIIAKQRNGPTDSIKLTWDQATTRFKDYGTFTGGTGLSPTYAAHGRGRPSAPAAPDPFGAKIEVVPFSPGKKTGPVANHRDGGGPDKDYDDSGDVGLPE
ncbi:MAG TPA: replicative DNA helicase [Phycisphaerales bacterium]|nr:replicative DNA helicase [Phycisphaerales bacterium]